MSILKKNLVGFIGIFFLLGLVVFPFFRIKAQQEIKLLVSPELFELSVERNEILADKIKIYNQSEVPIPIQVKVTNFGAQEESGTITFFEEPAPREGQEDDISYNPRKWIRIENPDFILDSGETEEVRFLIEVPENAEPGGHYAVVLFEPQLPSYYFQEGQLPAIPIIGVLVLLSIKVEGLNRPEEILTIVEFSIPEKFHLKNLERFLGFVSEALAVEKNIFSIMETSHLSFTLRIKNNDIYHIKPKGNLIISKNNDKIVGETEIPKTTILPGKTRQFPVEFKPKLPEKLEKYLPDAISNFISQNLLWGKYTAHLLLTTDYGKIEKSIEFWVFPWKITIVVLFIVILLVLMRKRIMGAGKILVSPKLKIKS